MLLNRHRKKSIIKEKETFKQLFAGYNTDNVELNLMTKTGLNQSLLEMFPQATLNYFEHGMGDYYYILEPDLSKGNFYCVFAEGFKKQLNNKHIPHEFVYPLLGDTDFSAIANRIIDTHPKGAEIRKTFSVPDKTVVILMESVEIYNVPDNFWTDYIDLCLSKIDAPKEYHFLIKPHHLQSFNAIEITRRYFEKLGLKATFTDNDYAISFSAEVLFCLWKQNARYVFSLFSSSIYYVSKLYADERITYYYGYDFFKNYLHNSPPQFIKIFKGIESVIKEVLSENCKKMA